MSTRWEFLRIALYFLGINSFFLKGWRKLHYAGAHASAQRFSRTNPIFLLLWLSQMTQAQLETLQTENQHLKDLLQKLESKSPKVSLLWHSHYIIYSLHILQTAADRILFLNVASVFVSKLDSSLPQRGDSSLASLRESYMSSLSSLEQENRQLRQAIAEMHARLEASNRTCHDRYEQALLSHATPDQPQPAQDRYLPAYTKTHTHTHKRSRNWTLMKRLALSVAVKILDIANTGRRRCRESQTHPLPLQWLGSSLIIIHSCRWR